MSAWYSNIQYSEEIYVSFPKSGNSSFQVVRPVHRTPEVERILRHVVEYATEMMDASEVVPHIVKPFGTEGDVRRNRVRYVPVLPIDVYGIDQLVVPIYEREAPPSQNFGHTFGRVMDRISRPTVDTRPTRKRLEADDDTQYRPQENPIRGAFRVAAHSHDILDSRSLRVRFEGIQELVRTSSSDTREYGFSLRHPSAEADLLADERRVITTQLERMAIGDDVLTPDGRTTLTMPFAQIPHSIPDDHRHAFLERVAMHSSRFMAELGEITYVTRG